MLLTSIGYVLFYSSSGFLKATLSFIFLGFFVVYANTGYATFFQKPCAVDMMGSFGSIEDMFQGMIQLGLTLVLGLKSVLFSLQFVKKSKGRVKELERAIS